ncbi:host-nuclease inhibitor Gam family protein [Limnobaculum xujianqingii]|uniref:host-nuclease inhibitor Gam family protein n=1 Tax=Limnobaculum xujianqingii TaxID=2738837 RepID=UPI0011268095|nr:host-nuclease inhibitor Gam family protein [Limnobaculum xujianqingii]
MAKTPKKRLKSAAAVYVSQSRDDAIADIKKIGDITRELIRTETEMNDEIGTITKRYVPVLEGFKSQVETLQTGVQTWCETNRDELTNKGKTKSANLITGEVQWRNRPPSITIRGAETVIENLRRLKLERFIRTKEEANKEAMLNEPDIVRGIAGITVNTGIEDFVIVPFEQESR